MYNFNKGLNSMAVIIFQKVAATKSKKWNIRIIIYLTFNWIRLIGNRSITLLSIRRGRVTRSKDVQSLQKQLLNNCNVPQDRILKTINISSFTAHNIVKGFKESGAISVHSIKAENQSCALRQFMSFETFTDITATQLPMPRTHTG